VWLLSPIFTGVTEQPVAKVKLGMSTAGWACHVCFGLSKLAHLRYSLIHFRIQIRRILEVVTFSSFIKILIFPFRNLAIEISFSFLELIFQTNLSRSRMFFRFFRIGFTNVCGGL
jgi:hypothetical protein